MSDDWIKIMCAEADRDGKVGEARVVLMAETVDWAAHVSAAMYHMDRVKCGDVAMVDEAALQRVCSYVDSNVEVLTRSADPHLIRLMALLLDLLDASMQYRPGSLFRSDDKSKLKPVADTHCSPGSWREAMERQARNLAARDRARDEEG